MSPEYALNGLYSEKLDVFSFGIIVLEILSGKRNIAFCETLHTSNLVGYVSTLDNSLFPQIVHTSGGARIFLLGVLTKYRSFFRHGTRGKKGSTRSSWTRH